MIKFDLTRCDKENEGNCKTDKEIKEYFKGSYIIVLMNKIRFDSSKFGEESIVRESIIHWLPIST